MVKYEIWHVDKNHRGMTFFDIDAMRRFHFPVCSERYTKVYEGSIEGEIHASTAMLNELFRIFNSTERPSDYKAHSMSVSDVIVLCPEGMPKEAWFTDSVGFKHVPDFFRTPDPFCIDEATTQVELEGLTGTCLVIDRVDVGGKPYSRLRREREELFIDGNGDVICRSMDAFAKEDWRNILRWDALAVPVMPDPTISMHEMRQTGYTWPGMLPLREEAALICPLQVYLLYEDGTESATNDEEEIKTHIRKFGGICGVEKVDWLNYCQKHGAAPIVKTVDAPKEIDLRCVASEIVSRLKRRGFNDCTDSSGYFTIKDFGDGAERCVDVYKTNGDGIEKYTVYCSYEDEQGEYYFTEDLSVEDLERVLREIAED